MRTTRRRGVFNGKIPVYSCDNEPRGHMLLARAEKLAAEGFVRLVRHRKGHINCCIQLRGPKDAQSLGVRNYNGQRYSFLEKLDNDLHAWELKRLGRGNSWRPIFTQVLTDCLVKQGAPA